MKDASWVVELGSDDDMKLIDTRLGEYNGQKVPFTQAMDIKNGPTLVKNYVLRENGTIIAGIKSDIYGWGILFIELLFVDQDHRHRGLGSYLLKKVESDAKEEIGASLAHTDTFDFQAKDFYLKHGYEIFGVLDDCPPGHKRYYLKKVL